MSTSVCVDASFVLHLVLGGTSGPAAADAWRAWTGEDRAVAAPSLLLYEVTNVVHRYLAAGRLDAAAARDAIEAALGLPVTLQRDADLHRRAVALARELGLAAAYDAHYLALAERLGCELWTADRRLVAAVGGRLPWVRLLA